MEYAVWSFVAGWWYTSLFTDNQQEAFAYFTERMMDPTSQKLRIEADKKIIAWFERPKE